MKKIGLLIIPLFYLACKKDLVVSDKSESKNDFYTEYAIKNLPTAPQGKKWTIDQNYTDEFNKNELDMTKWDNQISTWKGRAPGLFMANNVQVKDSVLTLKNTWLDTLQTVSGAEYTIGCAAVRSRNSQLTFPVYTETRMKASDISLSSTFWLVTDTGQKYPNATDCKFSYGTELDVIETTGGAYDWDTEIKSFNTQLKSNTHFRTRPCEGGSETFFSKGPSSPKNLGFTTHSGFHTYGVYWIDATQCKIYVDGVEFYNLIINDTQKANPFDLPMGLRMVTETYNWLNPPSKEMLKDNTKNTTYYDWVRTYKLVNN
jgi:beta-porphyranase